MYHIDRGAWAEINLDAVAHNVQIAKSNLDPHTKLCAVVKADAYGHGAVAVAREAEKNGADFLAVALLHECLELREAVSAAYFSAGFAAAGSCQCCSAV